MKSDSMGTWTEQVRARMGWITNAQRKERVSKGKLKPGHVAGEKCMCCDHLVSNHGDRCSKGDFVTRVNCYCNEFDPKK
jgi:hypothetical protein